MLWRKKENQITAWIKEGKQALLVTGARQVGKTFLIEECLKKEKKDFVYFNFIDQPNLIKIFDSVINEGVDSFIERISLASSKSLVRGQTIIFFDEIQMCKEIVTKIKFLVKDGSFKYVLSGSLLGIELSDLKSAPVGYLKTIEMYPLDFEEFCVAQGIKETTLKTLKNCFDEVKEVDDFIHATLIETFKRYLIIGGMPQAVSEYIKEHDFNKVSQIHQDIINQYRVDFTKYEKKEKLKLLSIYDLIPSELASDNKRYMISNINSKAKFNRYENSFNWLVDAGVAIPVYIICQPRLPLEINKKSNLFKLFLSDIGLLTTLYGKATQLAIINDDKSLNCGAIYENAVAQELHTHGFKGYYFNSHKQGELDFVIEFNGKVTPIEVKSGSNYKHHQALSKISRNPNYGISQAFVLSKRNVSKENDIIYYPIYMLMFISDEYIILPNQDKIDLSNL